MPNGTLAGIIKDEIASRGLTQSQFADSVGVSRQTVTNWLSGKTLKKEHLEAVASYLGYEYSDLAAVQAGIRPVGAIRSDRGKRVAKRLESMPEDVQAALEALVEVVQAAINPRYRDWEADQKKRSKARSSPHKTK